MIDKKGAQAMEFLMTYGWTIIAAIISIAALAQFGVFGGVNLITGASFCNLPPSGITCIDHQIGDNGVIVVLQNGLGVTAVDVTVNIENTNAGTCTETSPPAVMLDGEQEQFFIACTDIDKRNKFIGDLVVNFKKENGQLQRSTRGSVSGAKETEEDICIDADEDGYEASICGGSDCDDTTANANPGLSENTATFCSDGIDNDCDNLIDGDDLDCVAQCPLDNDGDTYISDICEKHGGNDCDDNNNAINPGAPENTEPLCSDGIDNDCDGLTDIEEDPDCGGLSGCYDDDLDTYKLEGFYCDGDWGNDCNDDDEDVNPGVPEDCNTPYDDNCDGDINENCPEDPCDPGCDVDEDGYCSTLCAGGNDCNDNDPLINPGYEDENNAALCSDLRDNDCDLAADCFDICCQGQGGSPIFSPLFKEICVAQPNCGEF
jgi:hypothetical protein